MLDFRGSITVVTDINLAMQYSQVCKIVNVGELNPYTPKEFIEYSLLLPPYQALEAEINGDMAAYEMYYDNYLSTSEACFSAIASLIVAAYHGTNIIMYIEEGNNLSHKQFLIKYIYNRYGILLGSDNTVFEINPNYENIIRHLLYSFMDGFISFDYYMDCLAMSNIFDVAEFMIKTDAYFMFTNSMESVAGRNKIYGDINTIYSYINSIIYKRRLIIQAYSVKGPVIVRDVEVKSDNNTSNKKKKKNRRKK